MTRARTRAAVGDCIWRNLYGIDGIRASRGIPTCARERAYSSAFLSVCVSPERLPQRDSLTHRWWWVRGGETRGDRDAPPNALGGWGRVKTPRVVAANDHATQRLARCAWVCEAGKWRVHRRARAFIVRTDGARRPASWARSGGNLRRERRRKEGCRRPMVFQRLFRPGSRFAARDAPVRSTTIPNVYRPLCRVAPVNGAAVRACSDARPV